MSNNGNLSKVGDLLVEAGVLTEQALKEGMELSSTLGQPIGKTMVMSGVLSEKTVRAAVLVRSMIKDGLLDRDIALKALARTAESNIPIEDSLIELGWRPLSDQNANKIGQLLVEAGAISQVDLKEAMDQVNKMGLPLSRVLVLTGKVPGTIVWCALNAQIFLREKSISIEQAISAIRAVHERQISFEQGLQEQGLADFGQEHKIKLGELLVLSGLVGEEEILGAVEESVSKEHHLGKVLVSSGLISSERLADALKLQEMTDNKSLSPLQSVDVLRTAQTRNHSLNRAVAELGLLKLDQAESLKLGEMLKLCGWVTEQEIDEAVGLASKNSNLVGKMLVAFGFIDETMLYNVLRCQFLVREGFIKRDQAIIALHFSQSNKCSLEIAFNELGYTTKPIPQDTSAQAD